MQQEYALQKKPLVYENLRRLTYSPDADPAQLAQRFGDLLTGDGWRIISTSGCSLQRTRQAGGGHGKAQAALHCCFSWLAAPAQEKAAIEALIRAN